MVVTNITKHILEKGPKLAYFDLDLVFNAVFDFVFFHSALDVFSL